MKGLAVRLVETACPDRAGVAGVIKRNGLIEGVRLGNVSQHLRSQYLAENLGGVVKRLKPSVLREDTLLAAAC